MKRQTTGHAAFLYSVCACLLGGCDPGWMYVAPDGVAVEDDRLRYKLNGPDSTSLRIYGSSFVFDLSVELDITNAGKSTLEIRPEALAVVGLDSVHFQAESAPSCRGSVGTPVRLAPGGTCSIDARLKLPPADPDKYRNLTVTLPNLSREARAFDLSVRLVMKE